MITCLKSKIVKDTTNFVVDFLQNKSLQLKIEKLICGATFTFVVLNDQSSGLAKTECYNDLKFNKLSIFYPGNIIGAEVLEILNSNQNDNLAFVIKLAVLNAVSSIIIPHSQFEILYNTDPFNLLDFKNKKITIVGAFRSYIQKLHQQNADFRVLELNKNAIDKEFLSYYKPANKYLQEFEISHIIILTGSILANKTFDRLVSALPQKSKKIIVGPSAGLPPKLLFDKGIDIIGTTKVLDNQKTYQIIAQGGSAVHLFEQKAAQKICILNNENN